MIKRDIVIVLYNIRSTHNVGSILRTADGFGVEKVFLTGYTPSPKGRTDIRLPHISAKIDKQISKTSLGAEKSVNWEHIHNVLEVINDLKKRGYMLLALEQDGNSIELPAFKQSSNVAVILGNEVRGIGKEILDKTDKILEIPMSGTKESFNVSVACGITLYHIKYIA